MRTAAGADSSTSAADEDEPDVLTRENLGLLVGPLAFVIVYVGTPFAIPSDANAVLAGTLWIAIWWMTEAVPIPVTSLLPVALFPLTDVGTVADATTPYADPIIFLLLGGFLLALAIEYWDLHRRIALTIVNLVGASPGRLLFGFMLATAVLSMWISNTATAMMMVPIGTAVVTQYVTIQEPDGGGQAETADDDTTAEHRDNPNQEATMATAESVPDPEDLPRSRFGIALLLGIAYGASIGGAATIIGSPPNAVFAGVAGASLGVDIGFFDWMLFALPASAILLVATWYLLLVLLRPERVPESGIEDVVQAELEAMGALGRGERRVLSVFAIVAGGWILRPFLLEPIVPALTDETIAIIGAILLFVVPVNLREREFLLEWEAVADLPWGVLLLLGAGFSIANAFQLSGLDELIANALAVFADVRLIVLLLIIAGVVVFLTEINSNTATATVFIPIMIGLGATLGIDPLGLMALTALSASFAFMLPVATPPNAIVFGAGYLTIPDMVRIGIWLNLLGIGVTALLTFLWFPFVFG
ncbi:DASS family sodium-coupled anion symporter [Natronorubrum sp. A-ect3]|uniref:SLC13 family permease n=1 Tax=Natronorubrum sp. A-ect3 TaxID=3242698 RepID=UPI00359E53DF